jgi:hypothetical protein
MDPSNIPKHILRIIQDRELPMHKKMVAFTAFMPSMPDDPKNDRIWEDNLEVGEKIKKLVDEGKIRLGKFDANFNLSIEV